MIDMQWAINFCQTSRDHSALCFAGFLVAIIGLCFGAFVAVNKATLTYDDEGNWIIAGILRFASLVAVAIAFVVIAHFVYVEYHVIEWRFNKRATRGETAPAYIRLIIDAMPAAITAIVASLYLLFVVALNGIPFMTWCLMRSSPSSIMNERLSKRSRGKVRRISTPDSSRT